jgi:hypothetical protein
MSAMVATDAAPLAVFSGDTCLARAHKTDSSHVGGHRFQDRACRQCANEQESASQIARRVSRQDHCETASGAANFCTSAQTLQASQQRKTRRGGSPLTCPPQNFALSKWARLAGVAPECCVNHQQVRRLDRLRRSGESSWAQTEYRPKKRRNSDWSG